MLYGTENVPVGCVMSLTHGPAGVESILVDISKPPELKNQNLSPGVAPLPLGKTE